MNEELNEMARASEREAIVAYLETVQAKAIEATDFWIDNANDAETMRYTAIAKTVRDAIRWIRSRT